MEDTNRETKIKKQLKEAELKKEEYVSELKKGNKEKAEQIKLEIYNIVQKVKEEKEKEIEDAKVEQIKQDVIKETEIKKRKEELESKAQVSKFFIGTLIMALIYLLFAIILGFLYSPIVSNMYSEKVLTSDMANILQVFNKIGAVISLVILLIHIAYIDRAKTLATAVKITSTIIVLISTIISFIVFGGLSSVGVVVSLNSSYTLMLVVGIMMTINTFIFLTQIKRRTNV